MKSFGQLWFTLLIKWLTKKGYEWKVEQIKEINYTGWILMAKKPLGNIKGED